MKVAKVSQTLTMCGMASLLLLGPVAWAKRRPEHPYRYSIVDMPVSLAIGTVRTPAFPVAKNWYWIMVQVEKPLPFMQMVCMMGVTSSPLDLKDCSSNDPLLRADWTVWDGDHFVKSGSSTTAAAGMFTDKYIFKFLGDFPGQAGRKFVVDVKFTRDGTPLNVAQPHLIVVKEGKE
jgi:hypothetical protein